MEEDDFISLHRKAKADTEKRERERESDQLGRSADQSSKLSSKKSRCTKETNTVTGQVLATEYS